LALIFMYFNKNIFERTYKRRFIGTS